MTGVQTCALPICKTLIAVTHDERLAKYFDCVIDMNEMTSGIVDIIPEGEANL